MVLRYALSNGDQRDFKVGKGDITIGRSVDADVSIPDKMASRIH